MKTNKFYDVHYHAMDLSHANITAFADRFINNESLIKSFLRKTISRWQKVIFSLIMPLIGPFIPYSTLAKRVVAILNKQKKVRNLLSFMETSVLYDFLIVEYFLKNKGPHHHAIISENNEFEVAGQIFNKMVICPLIMDFGYPNIKNADYVYNIPPQKPITSQIEDLFKAIRNYYTKEISIDTKSLAIKKFEIKDKKFDKDNELLEIYPFMGINTANYELPQIKKMLDKYFSKFLKEDTKEARQNKLYQAMGEFDGNLEDEENCKNIFAGIKFYPPLGFNPWPESCSELEKVEYLYKYCIDRNIPIVTHCSTGGFVASPEHKDFSNPNTHWNQVLNDERFHDLKIDFAHFGENDEAWINKIMEFASNSNHNVYADFSSNGDNPEYYTKLKKQLESHDNQADHKVMYGSDFMINLLKVNSLNEYMNYFIKTKHLTDEQKIKFIQTNPEEFLFGH